MPNETSRPERPRGRLKSTVLVVMSVLILVPSMLGFAMKFAEFIRTFQQSADGAFAITPMLNYLLASLGFFSLLIWAAANGMFRDIEQPKYRMLEVDAELNAERNASRSSCLP